MGGSGAVITRIRIRGFRGIREGELSGLEQFTILIGRNGSGKSSVLEAVYAASAHKVKEDPIRGVHKLDYIIKRRGGRGDWASMRQVLWYRMDTERPIEVELSTGQATA